MSTFLFEQATKSQARAKVALVGPAGSGKTYTALAIGTHLGDRVAVIDTEHRTASKYADLFRFSQVALDDFRPANYIAAMTAAVEQGFDVVVIDSLSHAWMGKGGILEQVDNYGRSHSGNSFGAWRDATPQHVALIEAMLSLPAHLIVTMRVKTEYVIEKNEKGKSEPRKVGLAPVQRDGLEYEFDVVADLTTDNDFVVTKTRCPELRGVSVREAGKDVAGALRAWLEDGEPIPDVDDYVAQVLDPATTVERLRAIRGEVVHHGYAARQVQDPAGQTVPLVELVDMRGRAMKAQMSLSVGELAAQESAVQPPPVPPSKVERVGGPVQDDPWAGPAPEPERAAEGAPWVPQDEYLTGWKLRVDQARNAAEVRGLRAELTRGGKCPENERADAEAYVAAAIKAKAAS